VLGGAEEVEVFARCGQRPVVVAELELDLILPTQGSWTARLRSSATVKIIRAGTITM
jgi:hypothetical protein